MGGCRAEYLAQHHPGVKCSMTSIAFADALRPARVRILRCPLLTYTLGHELILLRERNPLVILDGDDFDKLPDWERRRAVMLAVLVCERPAKFHGTPSGNVRLWTWLNRNSDYDAAVNSFRRYRYDGSTFPMPPDAEADGIANGKDSGRALGGELLTRLVNFLAPIYLAFGHETLFDFPMGVALHLYFTQLEIEGRMRIENEKERQIKEEMQQHLREIEAEREAEIKKAMAEKEKTDASN